MFRTAARRLASRERAHGLHAICRPRVHIQWPRCLCLKMVLMEEISNKRQQFVQMLSNPLYLQHLAAQKLLDNEDFVAYLKYLQYFREPKYLRYLMYGCLIKTRLPCPADHCISKFRYPGPTLRALELLQEERFRKDILIPEVMSRMVAEGFRASTSAV